MDTDEFDYELPEARIAQVPIEPRDAARLLVDRGHAPPEHRNVRDLPELLDAGDLLVVNETKVIPARIDLRRSTGGRAEVLLLEPLDEERRRWEALIRPAKRLRPGERLATPSGEEVVEIGPRSVADDTFEVRLLVEGDEVDALGLLDDVGQMPLPPYIHERLETADRYQTVYANEPGSAAAPTAGLHFTAELLSSLQAAGIGSARVELVVGLDTFRPISAANPLDHRMHSERYRVPEATLDAVAATHRAGGRVVAVGTTTVRALESAAATGQRSGRTELFIYRGFDFRTVDLMLTNFHLPRTTLLMMIDAFVGPRWRRLYEEAIEHRYRFLSFGDAMLLNRHR